MSDQTISRYLLPQSSLSISTSVIVHPTPPPRRTWRLARSRLDRTTSWYLNGLGGTDAMPMPAGMLGPERTTPGSAAPGSCPAPAAPYAGASSWLASRHPGGAESWEAGTPAWDRISQQATGDPCVVTSSPHEEGARASAAPASLLRHLSCPGPLVTTGVASNSTAPLSAALDARLALAGDVPSRSPTAPRLVRFRCT